MNSIIPEFKNSLKLNEPDVIKDYIELGIDSFMDDDSLMKDIPIVRTISDVGKFIYQLNERKMINNMRIFINELNNGSIDKNKLDEYIKKLDDHKKAEKELGRFLLLLNQSIDNERTCLYAKVFKAYINEQIEWNDVIEFTEIVSRLFIVDINLLNDIYMGKEIIVKNKSSKFRVDRLYSLGIIGFSPKSLFPGGGTEEYVMLNEIGKVFSDVIFK